MANRSETPAAPRSAARRLSDDTLIVFLSDSHIGGDGDRDIFESPDDLAALFDDAADHDGPVELVLAGDFFDFLRTASVQEGSNRARETIARPEYRDLFAALRRFAAGEEHRVTYMPGNHDAEMWWNPEIQAELRAQQIVHEFALSYAAVFEGDPEHVVYCEHGNQFDPPNTIHDYADGLDTPIGHHLVTDVSARLPEEGRAASLRLRDVDRVFPLFTIPAWVAGRLFYQLVTLTLKWLVLPLLVLLAVYETVAALAVGESRLVDELFVDLGYEAVLVVVVFAVFLTIARVRTNRAIRAAGGIPIDPTAATIRPRLEAGEPSPQQGELAGSIAVFVSGHTHAPALSELDGPAGRIAFVNSGCWLRQVQPVTAHLRLPAVYASHFIQTHVRVRRTSAGTEVELWEHPRAAPQRPPAVERLAIAGRLPAQPESRTPRVRARSRVGLGTERG